MSQESRVRVRGAVVASSVILLVLAACGGSATSKSDVPTNDASDTSSPDSSEDTSSDDEGTTATDLCEVVSADDAADVFGEPATRQESTSPEPLVEGVCIYGGESQDIQVRNLLQVRVYDGEQFYGKTLYPNSTAVSGLGDEAFADVNSAAHSVNVQFLKDGKTGVVNYTVGPSVDIESKLPAVESVARTLAAAM